MSTWMTTWMSIQRKTYYIQFCVYVFDYLCQNMCINRSNFKKPNKRLIEILGQKLRRPNIIFGQINCPSFWSVLPNFTLIYGILDFCCVVGIDFESKNVSKHVFIRKKNTFF